MSPLKIPLDIKYEWYVFEDRVEINLNRPNIQTKPDGVYVDQRTFEMYRLTYATIGEMGEQNEKTV